jgi:hypothetical protein
MEMDEKNESLTATPSDAAGQRDRSEPEGSAGGRENQSAEKAEQGVAGSAGMVRGRFRAMMSNRKKSILIALLGLVSIAIGLSRTLGLNGTLGFRPYPRMSNSSGEPRDHYVEESLSPFFVPLPSTSAKRVAVIDFSVIWDGVASVRFKRKELQIRDSLYRSILERTKEGFDLHEQSPILEAEMSRTFRKSLGSKEIEIRIKSVKVL